MTIRLVDYKGDDTVVEIGELDTIAKMTIKVVTGDEILTVIYKDYRVREFDSCYTRNTDYFDDEYIIYDFTRPEESLLLHDDDFNHRHNTYWMWRRDY